MARDGPKTLAIPMVYTDQSQEHFDRNLRPTTTVTTYDFFFNLQFSIVLCEQQNLTAEGESLPFVQVSDEI